MSTRALDCLFNPGSVAVLGATQNPAKLGYVLVKNLIDYGYQGRILPVNPRGGEVLGQPAARSITELQGQVDLALISIPNAAVPDAIAACATAGVRAAVILSSGFGETGAAGRQVQAFIKETAGKAGMRVVGPNCMGVYNPGGGLNASYFWALPKKAGPVSFISQSGAMGGIFFAEAAARGFGVAKFISVGNCADIEHSDMVAYLGDDPDTKVIAVFMEGLKDGRRFLEAARRVVPIKPIVVLKGGRTGAGARAAASHTGSLAGAGEVYRAALEQVGVLWAESTEELWDLSIALAYQGDRLPRAGRLAVLTISGGPSVLAADACEERGLEVPALAEAAQADLRRLVPDFAAVGNPVDMTPQVTPANIPACIDRVLAEPNVDGAVFINMGLDYPEFGQGLTAAFAKHQKPILALVNSTPTIEADLDRVGIPVFSASERAVTGFAGLVRYAAIKNDPPKAAAAEAPAPAAVLSSLPAGPVDEYVAKQALAAYGLPVTRDVLVKSRAEALAAAAELGYPVALKLCRADVLHKSDVGGVHLNLAGPDDLDRAFAEISSRFADGPYLVQEMVPPGLELIIGARRDATFGHVVLCGLGGIFVEAVGKFALAVAPLDDRLARRLIRQSGAERLLGGYRGGVRIDLDQMAACLLALSRLVTANPRIAEVDINPLIAGRAGLRAADALIVLS